MRTTTKKTQSVCQNCYRKIPAQIYEKKGQVFILKHCPRHGTFTELIEKDAGFYRWFTRMVPQPHLPFSSLMLPITPRCNLFCRDCFFHYAYGKDRPTREIIEIIKNFNGKNIELSGGEPTLREDLASVIGAIKNLGKNVILDTNGVKLADLQYLKSLKKAGLTQVLFSLDSLKSAFYEKICGKSILAIKQKALGNLEHEQVATILSATIYPGLNDRELNDLFIFALRHSHFIRQLRLRAAVHVRSPAGDRGYGLSGLFDLFSKQINIDKNILKKNFFTARLGRSAIFHFAGRINGKKFTPCRRTALEEKAAGQARKELEVKIVSWPTVKNIDLQDLKTAMAYVPHKSHKPENIFYGLILAAKSQQF